MADTKMSEKLWRDCKSDQERADFILCGRAHETGVIATSIQSEVAMAFQRLATLQSLTSINFTLPNHEPTIAIGEILDGYDGDDRDDVWESIKAYADVHARAALEATPPADAALADLADALDEISQMRVGTPYQRNMLSGEQRNALTQAAAALRARQPVKDSFNSRQLKDQASAWEAVYEELLKINPRLSELAPSGKACAIAEIKRLAALRARQQVVVPEDKPFAYGVEFDGINRTERMTNLSADVLRTFTGFEPFPLYRRKK